MLEKVRGDQIGVEPRSASAGDDIDGCVPAVGMGSDVDHLRVVNDSRGERDLISAQAVGSSAAVPTFVDLIDRFGYSGWKSEVTRYVGCTLASAAEVFIERSWSLEEGRALESITNLGWPRGDCPPTHIFEK